MSVNKNKQSKDFSEMKKPTISVIVPIYNVEIYLHRCIDSILIQTFTDFELLLIDDGSTDSSGNICDEYALKDSRIRVFHQKNGGVSSARNKGLCECIGEWVQFIDSDDWIEPYAFQTLIDAIDNGTDMVLSDYYVNIGNRQTLMRQDVGNDLLQSMLDKKVGGYLWNKLFRRCLVVDSEISFNHNLTFCEDLIFVIELCLLRRLCVVNNAHPAYHYCLRKNSITQYPKDVKLYINQVYKYINVGTAILKETKYGNERTFFSTKIGLKWGLLRFKCSWNDYKQVFPEVFRQLESMSQQNLKQRLIRMTNCRVGFTVMQFVVKLAYRLNLQYCLKTL